VNVRDADRQGKKAEDAKKVIDAVDGVKNYTYTMVDGNLYYRENSEMRLQEFTGAKAERIKGLHSVRQALRRVIDIQTQGL